MSSFKAIVARIAGVFLPIMLFSFGAYFCAYQFLASPAPVKDALNQGGMYQAMKSEVLDRVQRDTSIHNRQSILNDPKAQEIIEQSIPANSLQQPTEGIIDNIYAWLHGKDNTLQSTINLQDLRTRLADAMATYTTQHLNSLPACQGREMPDLTQPLSATCLPPHVDTATVAATVRNDVLHDPAFIEASQLSTNDIMNNQGQTLDQQLAGMPSVYKHVQRGTYITAGLAIVLAVAVITLNQTLPLGLKRFGRTAVIIGLISAVVAWLVGFGLQKATGSFAGVENWAILESAILRTATLLTQDLRNWWAAYGIGLAIAGVVALIVAYILKRQQAAALPAMQPVAPHQVDVTRTASTETTNSSPSKGGGTQPPTRTQL